MTILHVLWLMPLLAAAVLALIGFAGAAVAGMEGAPDEPRPTRDMLESLANFYGWVLTVPLSREQREDLERAVIEAFSRRESTTIGEVSRLLERARGLALRGEVERGRALPLLHAQILADARRRPDSGLARWLGTVASATSARVRRSPTC